MQSRGRTERLPALDFRNLVVASLMHEGAPSISSELGDLARQRLREAIAIYGRAAFEEPRRCEAILRDCCPTAPREVFLLVSALRENVAGELVAQEAGGKIGRASCRV